MQVVHLVAVAGSLLDVWKERGTPLRSAQQPLDG